MRSYDLRRRWNPSARYIPFVSVSHGFPHLSLPGITGGYGGDRRVEYIIPQQAREQGVHEFVIESSCNGMFGIPFSGNTIDPPDMNRYFSLASADLVVPNMEAWGLLWDFQTLRELVDTLPGNTPYVYFSPNFKKSLTRGHVLGYKTKLYRSQTRS